MKALCTDKTCVKCQCRSQETYFQQYCYPDLLHTTIKCGLAIEDSQYYGLETLNLRSGQSIGYVVHDKNTDSRKFKGCVISPMSSYWDTRQWSSLFTGGRVLENFRFLKTGDGLKMIFQGTSLLYTGMLIKLQLECHTSTYSNDIQSCLLLKIAGEREYNPIAPTTTTTTSTTTSTTTPPTTLTINSTVVTTKQTTPITAHATNLTTLSTNSLPTVFSTTTTTTMITRQSLATHTTTRQPSSSLVPNTEYAKERREMMTALILLVILISLILCIVFWCCCCRRKRSKTFVDSEGATLIQSTASYSSTEDTTHPAAINTDFSHIRAPNYCDEDELFGNGAPSRKNVGHTNRETERDQKEPEMFATSNAEKLKVLEESFEKENLAVNSSTRVDRPASRAYESEDNSSYPHPVGFSTTQRNLNSDDVGNENFR
uniref:Uncharacterized protein n=1 Tax=Clytia hemisphaerica TaxID=252671 RepID=A0A7M5VGW5_9CNID